MYTYTVYKKEEFCFSFQNIEVHLNVPILVVLSVFLLFYIRFKLMQVFLGTFLDIMYFHFMWLSSEPHYIITAYK